MEDIGITAVREQINPPTRRSPPETVEYLRRVHGIRMTVGTLAQHRSEGTGPAFRKERGGKAVIYDQNDVDEWAIARVDAPRRSTKAAG